MILLALLATAGAFAAGWWLGGRYATHRTRLRLLAVLAGIDAMNQEIAANTTAFATRMRDLHAHDSTPIGGSS